MEQKNAEIMVAKKLHWRHGKVAHLMVWEFNEVKVKKMFWNMENLIIAIIASMLIKYVVTEVALKTL